MLSESQLRPRPQQNFRLVAGKGAVLLRKPSSRWFRNRSHLSVSPARRARLCERAGRPAQSYTELLRAESAAGLPRGSGVLMTVSWPWTAVPLRRQQGSRCAETCEAADLEVWPHRPPIITGEGGATKCRAGPAFLL